MNVPQGNRALCFREAMAHVCSPRLPDAPIWIMCTVDGGDHKIVTGSVNEVEHRESNPLTYDQRVFGTHAPTSVL